MTAACPLLILRPEPGAGSTAAAAAARGLVTIFAPLFSVRSLDWRPPPVHDHDALLLTSANAVRYAGSGLAEVSALPVYAVGHATADAARAARLTVAHVGSSDAVALLADMRAGGIARPLHLAGRDHSDSAAPGITVTRRLVYASDAVTALPDAARCALDSGAIVLLHSPRAATFFENLLDRPRPVVMIAALSAAIAEAAGPGWAAVEVAETPTDAALLAAAARLCDGRGEASGGKE